ncbi:MAG TPA: SDR family NAD(P)-dependent oxidoreductase, partial [Thermoanaerobaculia bacterium]|nr:SDR family NAD(P)-dependent oxidoreductase [Thermoanaerobaculia bacterium]
ALLLGPVQVIPREMPEIACQSLDVLLPEPGSAAEEDLADDLVAEMAPAAVPPGATAVAFRDGARWLRGFGPARLEGRNEVERLREGGVYLITGGLGGVGLTLAEELAGRTRAKLVLTGRTALPPREEWGAWLTVHGDGDEVSGRIRKLQGLETLGAEVATVAADVTDPGALAAAVRLAEERFGALHGVIHAAGVPGGGIVHLETAESAERVMAAKVRGTLALEEALAGRRLDFVVLCSSITAVLGDFGQSGYCAANAFLDAYAQAAALRSGRRGPYVVSLGWDRWEEVGMAARSTSPAMSAARPGRHPLLDTLLAETPERDVYLTEMSPERHWVLSEHWIAGRPTVPGTTYLEMARAAFARRAAGRPVEIREAVFLAPLAIEAGAKRQVLTLLEKEGDAFAFRVVSRSTDGGELWQEHARGRIAALEEAAPLAGRRQDPAALLEACAGREVTSLAKHEGNGNGDGLHDAFLVTGPRWRSLKSLRVADDGQESVAVLDLGEELAGDLEVFSLHPALLDVAAGAVQLLGEGDFLPLAYESLRLHAPLTRRGYSHFRLRGGGAGEILTCDITLLDEEGRELVEIEGFSMRRVGKAAASQLHAGGTGGVRIAGLPALGESPKAAGHGIRPREGMEVFRRVLREGTVPHLVVSTRDLGAAMEEAAARDRSRVAAELEAGAVASSMAVAHARPEVSTSFAPPADDFERRIAQVWESVLGIDSVGVHDNFFELGGTSLTGIQLVTELKKSLSVDLPTVSIFEAPTVAALARYLRPAGGEAGSVASALGQTRSRAEKKRQALYQAQAQAKKRRR